MMRLVSNEASHSDSSNTAKKSAKSLPRLPTRGVNLVPSEPMLRHGPPLLPSVKSTLRRGLPPFASAGSCFGGDLATVPAAFCASRCCQPFAGLSFGLTGNHLSVASKCLGATRHKLHKQISASARICCIVVAQQSATALSEPRLEEQTITMTRSTLALLGTNCLARPVPRHRSGHCKVY